MKVVLTEEVTRVITPAMVTITMTEADAHHLERELIRTSHSAVHYPLLAELRTRIIEEIGQR